MEFTGGNYSNIIISNADLIPSANNTNNIGNSTLKFLTMYASSYAFGTIGIDPYIINSGGNLALHVASGKKVQIVVS